MIKYVDSTKMGRGIHEWLDTRHHFSFADYFNPLNMQFGALRVVNDDLVKPGKGFDVHPHRDMEIISYVIDGELTHGDSMGNKRTLSRGDVQYMSAGTGVVHSEHNFGSEMLRFLQIWILPDQKNYAPDYGDVRFKFEDRVDRWLPIAAWTENKENDAPIKIHQDMNIYATMIRAGKSLPFEIKKDRQAYMVLIEGSADVNGTGLNMRDAVEITGESIEVHAKEDAHLIILEMAQSK